VVAIQEKYFSAQAPSALKTVLKIDGFESKMSLKIDGFEGAWRPNPL